MNTDLNIIKKEFLDAAGRTAEAFGWGRTFGQIYFLLYFSLSPLCLDDISRELGISKGNASITIRELEKFKVVKRVWLKGDRKDYFKAEDNIPNIIREGILPLIEKKLNSADLEIQACLNLLKSIRNRSIRDENTVSVKFYEKRLKKLNRILNKLRILINNPLIRNFFEKLGI